MRLFDVNVLVYAYREAAPDHRRYREWLQSCTGSDESFAVSDLVLSGFVRIVTHPKIFAPPATVEQALQFVDALKRQPNCVPVAPGPRHWDIFVSLCRKSNARGNLVPDVYLAALAIESGCEWITTDGDYSRFPDLRWRHPLA